MKQGPLIMRNKRGASVYTEAFLWCARHGDYLGGGVSSSLYFIGKTEVAVGKKDWKIKRKQLILMKIRRMMRKGI